MPARDLMSAMTKRVRIGKFQLDMASGRLIGTGVDTPLPELSLKVLNVLIAHAPEPVSAQTLAEEAWGQTVVTEDTLTQRIKLLRQAFGETAQDATVIVTLRGQGYRLGVPVHAARTSPRPRPVILAGAGILALGMLGLGGLRLGVLSPESSDSAEPGAIMQAASEADLMLRRARDQLALHRPEETLRAVALLRGARALAPERSDIAIALSFALSTEVTKFSNAPNLVTEAESLARNVVEREPNNADAWSALGYAVDAQGRVSEAIAAYQQAILLDPNNVSAMSSAAYLLTVRGRLYDALKLDAQALAQGGGPIYTELQIAGALELLGERAQADQWLTRALRVNPDHPVITRGAMEMDLARGDDGTAAARLLSLPDSQRTSDHQVLEGWLALRRGTAEEARRLFEAAGAGWEQAIMRAARTGEAGEPDYGWPGDTWPGGRVRAAEMAAAAGQTDNAFERLNEAVDLGWRNWGALDHSPVLEPLKIDTRWQTLQARIDREVTAQRALFDADTELRAALALSGT